MKKSVMLIWKGGQWTMHEIETRTGLADDLPAKYETTHPWYPNHPAQEFVLAGRCGDIPLYKHL